MIEHIRVPIKGVLAGDNSINNALAKYGKRAVDVISITVVGEEFVVFYRED